MQEVVAGILMSFDVVALYLIATNVKAKWLLALWTAFLHMLFPLLGYRFGEWLAVYLTNWASRSFDTVVVFCGAAVTALEERGKFSGNVSPDNCDFRQY